MATPPCRLKLRLPNGAELEVEGTAEFIADHITGRITQEDARAYMLEHEEEIWKLFQLQKDSRDTGDWMWSTPSDPDQPRDLAYAFGARIVEAYYAQASDKDKAMREILSVINYPSFLLESRYGAQFSSTPGLTNDAGEEKRANPHR